MFFTLNIVYDKCSNIFVPCKLLFCRMISDVISDKVKKVLQHWHLVHSGKHRVLLRTIYDELPSSLPRCPLKENWPSRKLAHAWLLCLRLPPPPRPTVRPAMRTRIEWGSNKICSKSRRKTGGWSTSRWVSKERWESSTDIFLNRLINGASACFVIR